jgi:hypothetical protein
MIYCNWYNWTQIINKKQIIGSNCCLLPRAICVLRLCCWPQPTPSVFHVHLVGRCIFSMLFPCVPMCQMCFFRSHGASRLISLPRLNDVGLRSEEILFWPRQVVERLRLWSLIWTCQGFLGEVKVCRLVGGHLKNRNSFNLSACNSNLQWSG